MNDQKMIKRNRDFLSFSRVIHKVIHSCGQLKCSKKGQPTKEVQKRYKRQIARRDSNSQSKSIGSVDNWQKTVDNLVDKPVDNSSFLWITEIPILGNPQKSTRNPQGSPQPFPQPGRFENQKKSKTSKVIHSAPPLPYYYY